MPENKNTETINFEIAFFEKVLEKCPDYVEALIPLAEAYTHKGLYEKGLAVDEHLAKLCPQDSEVLYNLACSLALMNRPQEAVETLKRAVRFGFTDFSHMRKDPDLKSLHQDPGFKALTAKPK